MSEAVEIHNLEDLKDLPFTDVDLDGYEAEIIEGKKEHWKIASDEVAEWFIEKKADELVEIRRFKIALTNKIAGLQEQLDKLIKEEETIIGQRDYKLREYFESKGEKDLKMTKTQAKYRLPSAELIMKFPGPDYQRNEEKLAEWLMNNDLYDFVEVKTVCKPKWGDFKANVMVSGNNVVSKETGEIVDGVTVVEKLPEFKVDIK